MLNRLLIATLTAVLGATLAAPPLLAEDHAAVAPLLSGPPKPHVEVQPSNFQISSYVNFDEQGNVNSSQYQCTLSVRIILPKDLHATGYKDLHVTRIVTDDGTELAPLDDQQNRHFFNPGFIHNGNNNQLSASIRLPAPPAGTKTIRQITGNLTLQCLLGPVRKVSLPPLKDIADRRVKIQGLDRDVWVIVHPSHPGQFPYFRIEMPSHAKLLMSKIRFTDADGTPIESQSSGYGYNDSTVTLNYQVKLPPTGRITMEFYSKIDEVPVPFTIPAINLPQPPPPKGGELTVLAVPLDHHPAHAAHPAAPAPAAAAPHPADLRVTVE